MHFKIYDQLEYVSKYITLQAGDIIMTGTPEGFSAVKEGDHVEALLSCKGKVLAKINDSIQMEKI